MFVVVVRCCVNLVFTVDIYYYLLLTFVSIIASFCCFYSFFFVGFTLSLLVVMISELFSSSLCSDLLIFS